MSRKPKKAVAVPILPPEVVAQRPQSSAWAASQDSIRHGPAGYLTEKVLDHRQRRAVKDLAEHVIARAAATLGVLRSSDEWHKKDLEAAIAGWLLGLDQR